MSFIKFTNISKLFHRSGQNLKIKNTWNLVNKQYIPDCAVNNKVNKLITMYMKLQQVFCGQ